MPAKTKSTATEKKVPAKSELGKRRPDAEVEEKPASNKKKAVKAAAAPAPAQRRNIEEVDDTEFFRYATAVQNMLKDAQKRGNTDWWNICSIHGGGFGDAVKADIKPLMANYLKDYVANGLQNDWDDPAKFETGWMDMGFCAHGIPTFAIWHRVYVKAFELVLQQYDPAPENVKQATPLMAHYWHWDSPDTKAIPDRLNQPTLKINGKKVNNPLYQGISNEPNRLNTIRGVKWSDPDEGNVSPFQGLRPYDLDQAYQSLHGNEDYSHVCTINNGGPFSFEEPHNKLHNCVGGYDATTDLQGDMCDVPNSSFDPLFWLHHSNVERMHFAWIAAHGTPTELVFEKDKAGQFLDLSNLNLWPFPPKAQLTYANLPWKKGKGAGLKVASKPTEWWDNATLDYGYDNITDVGAPAPKVKVPKGFQKVRVVLNNLYVRGSGSLKAKVKIGDHEVDLHPRAMFSAPSAAPCPACDSKRLSLGWDVVVPQSAVQQATQASSSSSSGKGKKLQASAAAAVPTLPVVSLTNLTLNGKKVDAANIVEASFTA